MLAVILSHETVEGSNGFPMRLKMSITKRYIINWDVLIIYLDKSVTKNTVCHLLKQVMTLQCEGQTEEQTD